MSADNGHTVMYCEDDKKTIGIFYWSGDGDSPRTVAKAIAGATFDDPIRAILFGHQVEQKDRTEYGLSVQPQVLTNAIFKYTRGLHSDPI